MRNTSSNIGASYPTPDTVERTLDSVGALLCLYLGFVAGALWFGSITGFHDREQFYFGDLGIKLIYFVSAVLNLWLAARLAWRLLDKKEPRPSESRWLVAHVTSLALLPWIEFWHAHSVDARYFGPSIGITTNFGRVGTVLFMLYLILRVPTLSVVPRHDRLGRWVIVLAAAVALAAAYCYRAAPPN